MKNVLATLTLAATLATGSLPLNALVHPGYWHEGYTQSNRSDWMSSLRDGVKLSQLSIPGTHDTMALHWGDAVQTQSMPLDAQLRSGIRALDIRLMFNNSALWATHGVMYQFASFTDVLDTVQAFLSAHPRETVLMRVKMDSDIETNGDNTFEEVFRAYVTQGRYTNLFWRPNGLNPMLGEVRGKLVVLQNFPAVGRYGIDYVTLMAQDSYHLDSNWDLYNKWTAVKNHLINTNSEICLPGPAGMMCTALDLSSRDMIHINYLSGSGGAFPYFVASGKAGSSTGAPRLATGRTTPAFSGWPDFPRVNCLGSLCTIAFEGTNNLMYNLLATGIIRQRTGIIMADFPGPGLIEAIININNQFRQ